jgi:probable O-glycosylation ligase (exosortase A-associated)
MIFLTVALIYNRKRLKALIWVTALSLGFYGFKGGIWAILTGAQHRVTGPYRSFIEGNNELGLAMVMVLPLFILLAREETRVWLKYFLYSTFGLSVIAILSTYSRGAFLGLGVVLSALFLKARGKVIVLVLVIVAAPFVLNFLPEAWFERMDTIRNYKQDASANIRLVAWEVAYKIALDNPILGRGFRPFSPEIFEEYVPGSGYLAHDAHNIFLQVLAEHGFVGFGLYIALYACTFLSLRKIVRRGTRDPTKHWMVSYAQMIEAGLLGFVVSGFFLSLSYFDLFYVFVAMTITLKRLSLSNEPEESVLELSEVPLTSPLGGREKQTIG